MFSIEEYEGKQCIVIPLPNDKKCYIYPHYRELPLTEGDKAKNYNAKELTIYEALHDYDCTGNTDLLIEVESPGALYVREFGFDLPTPAILNEIMYYRKDINKLSKTINGDIIKREKNLWSCCKFTLFRNWFAMGDLLKNHNGFFEETYTYYEYLCVPVKIK